MKYLKIILLGAILTAMGGCSRPKEIPDQKLEGIFAEIFLVNTYCNIRSINTDSMNIYEPVLRKYGYKPRDLVYTLQNFSRRKSSRLSDVMEKAIEQLGRQYDVYAHQVAMLDTVGQIARERFREVVYTDTLIRAEAMKDTSRLRIRIPAREGQYKINYAYFVDTLDKNPVLRATHAITDSARHKLVDRVSWWRRDGRAAYEVVMDAPANAVRLEIVLGNYPPSATEPHVRIDTLTVVYYLPVETAVDSLTRSLFNYKLLIDGKEYTRLFAPDSLALRVDPPRAASRGDSVP